MPIPGLDKAGYKAWLGLSPDFKANQVELDRRNDTTISPELHAAIGRYALQDVLDSVDTLSDLNDSHTERQQEIEVSKYLEGALKAMDEALVDINKVRDGTHVEFGGDSKEARSRLIVAHVKLLDAVSTIHSIAEKADPGGFRDSIDPKARRIFENALRRAAKNYVETKTTDADSE